MRKLTILLTLLTLSAGLAQAQSVFTYTATEKLTEQFNKLGTVASHEFSNGAGTVTFSSNVTTINKNDFYGCTALQSISLPASVTTIGSNAFEGCTALQSVDFSHVSTIADHAFRSCTALQSINLPASVTSIKNGAFTINTLTSVAVAWTEQEELPTMGIGVFAPMVPAGATLCVPDGTKALYQAADVWKTFGTILCLTEVKDAAIAEINEAATAAKAVIDAASTYEEAKETQDYNKALIDATVMDATNAINNATNAAGVERERDECISTINEKRDAALAEIATINAKVEAIAEITAARHGIQNTNINNWIDGAITDIQASTAIEEIDRIKNEILEVINIFQDGKTEGIEEGRAEALGEMGTPCEDCPSIEVTKGDKTVKLYNPEKVEFGKEQR